MTRRTTDPDAKRVVVLGAGFAGLSAARELKRALGRRVAVTIVDRENYSLFTPMLPEVASGAIEPRHIAPSLRHSAPNCEFEFGEIDALDVRQRTVTLRDRVFSRTRTLTFDHAVIALGADTSTHGVPGASEHSIPLRTLANARDVRNRILGVLETAGDEADAAERARLATIVVVGGGFTGVEAAGELLAFLRGIEPVYPAVAGERLRVVLVAGGGELLGQLPKRFGDRAAEMLARRGVEVVFDDEVASLDENGVTLKSGTRYESRAVVWSAGVRPSPVLAAIDLPRSKHGALVVGADLAVPGHAGVWGAGDCAEIPKAGGGSYPQTAQNAVREGPRVARNVAASLRGRRTKAFAYRELGMMASIGDREGLAEIFGVMIVGFPAWLIWRTYYLFALPGIPLRIRVALDWTLALFFPPSISRM